MLRLIAFLLLASGASIGAEPDLQLRSGPSSGNCPRCSRNGVWTPWRRRIRRTQRISSPRCCFPTLNCSSSLLDPVTRGAGRTARAQGVSRRLLDLASSSGWSGKWFLQDMQADGLCAARDQTADAV